MNHNEWIPKRREIAAELFRATNYKVDLDDPLVTIAVFQSTLIRDAIADVNKAGQQNLAQIGDAFKREEQSLKARMQSHVNALVEEKRHALVHDSTDMDLTLPRFHVQQEI